MGDDFKFTNGVVVAYKEITFSDSPYSITSTSGPNSGQEFMLGVDTTVVLPTDARTGSSDVRQLGRMYYITDISNNASVNNIIIDANANATIASPSGTSQTTTMTSNGDSIYLVCVDATDDKIHKKHN